MVKVREAKNSDKRDSFTISHFFIHKYVHKNFYYTNMEYIPMYTYD